MRLVQSAGWCSLVRRKGWRHEAKDMPNLPGQVCAVPPHAKGLLSSLEPGEFAIIEFVIPRSSPYHRRHMAIESAVFNAQERFDDFEQFRVWLKVGAGWVDWCAGPKGGAVPVETPGQ